MTTKHFCDTCGAEMTSHITLPDSLRIGDALRSAPILWLAPWHGRVCRLCFIESVRKQLSRGVGDVRACAARDVDHIERKRAPAT